ncbi:MAG TPA: hypothetical protein VN851_19190 [Thermoanaerobaculia bacterium]|nr:hypothetical protein [Thermoanaerobaculia bacterium]
MAESGNALIDQVRSGGNVELRRLAASGLLPLPPEEMIPLQVELARSADSEIATLADGALAALDPRMLARLVDQTSVFEVLAFCTDRLRHPVVLEAILRRRDVPRQLLVTMARWLPADLQEILILRQDAIVDEPSILEALEENPQITVYTHRRILEYRQHLLPRAAAAAPEIPEISEEAFVAAIEAVKAEPAVGEFDDLTGLSEGQIRLLPVPARMRLTRGASKPLRNILIRDPVAQIALGVIANNGIPDTEAEQIARNRAVCEEVLAEIASRRDWISKYPIIKALVQNPRTPVVYSMRLVARLSVRDLRDMGRDRNIPDVVRSTALRLYRIKLQ